MIDMIGEWAIGTFQENGVIVDYSKIPIGVWTLDGTHFLITLNARGGTVVYEGTFDETTGTMTGTYKNYKYAWVAQIDDPAAPYKEGVYIDRKQK